MMIIDVKPLCNAILQSENLIYVICIFQKSGKTALMAAAQSGSVKVVRAILQNGCDPNVLDLRHNHAAHFAASNGHFEVC